MSQKPKISLYVTNYNYADYIDQAVESALAQTFESYEIIIIDDGSTDHSKEVIAKYEGHPKVRVIYQQNKGLNRTNNVAIKAARGDFVLRLDADDYLDENALLVLYNAIMSDDKVALVFSNYYYVDKAGKITAQERRHDFNGGVRLLDQPAHGACSLIRKEALIEVGLYSESFSCQDGYDMWLKLIENYQVKNVTLPLFYYRRHGNNLTENSERILKTRGEIYAAHVERIGRPSLATIAVIPVRGRSMEPACMALEPLRSKALIDWTIDAALESKSIFEVIVTSPDPDVYEHIKKTYGERVTFDFRDKKTSHENMSYDDAIKDAIRKRRVATVPDAVVCLTVEAPFRSGLYIEKAINTMRIFGTDSLIAVVPDNNLFYSHDGTGLFSVGINEKVGTLFLERDYIYRQAGGMFLVRHETYMRDDYKYPSKGIGHIVLSKMAGIKVASDEELFVAEALLDRADCERQRKAALAEQSSFKKRT